MQHLNLAAHRPEEYEGKLLVWNEVLYEIGPCVGISGSQIVHVLINRQSRLCLHELKILRRHRLGWTLSKACETLVVRRAAQIREAHPIIAKLKVPGGKVAIQECVSTRKDCNDPAAIRKMAESDAHRHVMRWAEAVSGYREVLQLNPSHTEAFSRLGAVLGDLGDAEAGRDAVVRAREIEPNYMPYYRATLLHWTRCGYWRVALNEYELGRDRLPHAHGLDDMGARIYIKCGLPEKAIQCARRCGSREVETEELLAEAKDSLRSRKLAQEIVARAQLLRDKPGSDAQVADLLQNAYALDSRNPLLAMNLAFALARVTRYAEAKELLLAVWRLVHTSIAHVCLANAAFSAIREGNLAQGMVLLEVFAPFLKSFDATRDSLIVALPGVGISVYGETGVREEQLPSAAEIVAFGVREYAKEAAVPEAVLALSKLYDQGAAETRLRMRR